MSRNQELMLEMAKGESDVSIGGIIEAAKAAMCDTRCLISMAQARVTLHGKP